MIRCLVLLLVASLLAVVPVSAAEDARGFPGNNCRHQGEQSAPAFTGPGWCGDGAVCGAERRGRCGKRRGDWYGARQPVRGVEEARRLLAGYFEGHDVTLSRLVEKRWGYRAEVLDRNGVVVDQVMIDKRSGRIRSLQ